MGMDLAPVSSRVHAESAGVAAQERDYGHTHPLVDHSYPTPEEHHVDVAAAKAELARVTSGNTTRTRRSSNATALGDSDKATPNTDIEKLAAGDGSGDDYEPFDLREWLGTIQPEAAQVGWKKKSLGVSWHDLAVRAANSTDMNVPTIPSMALFELIGPFLDISKMLGYDPFAPKERHILQNFNGCARPGEMVLVIGRPGSGCSTFLQTIANRREGFIGVDGDVSYGGIGAKEMNKHYQGEVVYSEEDDNHLATLTVGRTLDFALRLKSHRTPLPGYTKKEHRAMMRDTLLKTVNIAHTKDTLVGSATVRGVSGGERKRVSILEVLTAGASVMAWDNSTRGLDASTALDYAKSIRILTDMARTTSFVTVYQASEGIFNQCDKVLVIDEGRCMYFGPRDEARQYFIDLGYLDRPRSTSADWITSCTDPQTRAFAEGVDPKSVPTTSEAMEQVFMESDVHKRMMLDRDDYDAQVQAELKVNQDEFRQAVKDQKHRGVGKRSKYVVSYPLQIWALFTRSMQMQVGDPFDIFMSYMTSITIALISGGMFFKQPDLTSGIFTRGGALFNLLLFNSLTSFSELPVQMLGRPILARQTSFAFYRPSASFVSGLMADMPFGIPRVTIFIIILYFMAGLRTYLRLFHCRMCNTDTCPHHFSRSECWRVLHVMARRHCELLRFPCAVLVLRRHQSQLLRCCSSRCRHHLDARSLGRLCHAPEQDAALELLGQLPEPSVLRLQCYDDQRVQGQDIPMLWRSARPKRAGLPHRTHRKSGLLRCRCYARIRQCRRPDLPQGSIPVHGGPAVAQYWNSFRFPGRLCRHGLHRCRSPESGLICSRPHGDEAAV